MKLDPDRLIEVLASRLAAIVPDGFYVRGMDGLLWFSCQPGRFPGQLNDYHPGSVWSRVVNNLDTYREDYSPEESLICVARSVLDNLQDFVDEATHEPWPGERTPPHPHAEIRGHELHLWYGDADSTAPVVLACEPVPLALIERPGS
jgi:hypothetical protein